MKASGADGKIQLLPGGHLPLQNLELLGGLEYSSILDYFLTFFQRTWEVGQFF